MAREAQARLAWPWLWPEACVPEVYYARSRKLGFAKLLPTSSTERVRKRIRSDVICKQRRTIKLGLLTSAAPPFPLSLEPPC